MELVVPSLAPTKDKFKSPLDQTEYGAVVNGLNKGV
jgi:hypothetical protein